MDSTLEGECLKNDLCPQAPPYEGQGIDEGGRGFGIPSRLASDAPGA
jgi:hypothetical protein